MITQHATPLVDDIDERFHAARTERIHALTPGMLEALTARVAAGEAIGDADVTAALAAMVRTADEEAFAILVSEDEAREAASGSPESGSHRIAEVFDLFELEVAEVRAP
jgi:hypothetical protein